MTLALMNHLRRLNDPISAQTTPEVVLYNRSGRRFQDAITPTLSVLHTHLLYSYLEKWGVSETLKGVMRTVLHPKLLQWQPLCLLFGRYTFQRGGVSQSYYYSVIFFAGSLCLTSCVPEDSS